MGFSTTGNCSPERSSGEVGAGSSLAEHEPLVLQMR